MSDSWKMPRLEFHEDVEFILPIRNGKHLFIKGGSYPLEYGNLIVIPEGCLHMTTAYSSNYFRFNLRVPTKTLESLSTHKTDFTKLPDHVLCLPVPEESLQDMIRTLVLLSNPNPDEFGNDLRCLMYLAHFLTSVFHLLLESGEEVAPVSVSDRTSQIQEYIHAHLTEPLSLDQLASHFYLSRYYLSRTFKADTGLTVKEYIINLRILRARQLLRSGLSIREAGYAVGFRNYEHFIRTFTTLTGMSPKRYAMQYQL